MVVDPLLVVLAIDVSNSMRQSIRNDTNGSLSRFESIRDSLDTLSQKAKALIEQHSSDERKTACDVFVYAFGLQDEMIGVCSEYVYFFPKSIYIYE